MLLLQYTVCLLMQGMGRMSRHQTTMQNKELWMLIYQKLRQGVFKSWSCCRVHNRHFSHGLRCIVVWYISSHAYPSRWHASLRQATLNNPTKWWHMDLNECRYALQRSTANSFSDNCFDIFAVSHLPSRIWLIAIWTLMYKLLHWYRNHIKYFFQEMHLKHRLLNGHHFF